jgi:hypothetical protein
VPQSDPHHHPRPIERPTGRLTRRATIGSAIALTGALTGALSVSLAGCEWGPPDQVGAPEAKKDADDKLVRSVADAIHERGAYAGSIAGEIAVAQPLLAAAAKPFSTLNNAHYAVLGNYTISLDGRPVPTDPAAALAELRNGQLDLQKRLMAAAGEAVSGDLARTFASMAAAEAQLLALTPTTLKGAK